MKRDLDKAKAFERRGRESGLKPGKGLQPGPGPVRKTPMPRENRKRKAKMRAIEFGPQAAWCRHSPCAACYPTLYGDDLLALEYHSTVEISDPHHTVTRPGGLDRDTIPLCDKHHKACSAVNSSEKQVQRDCGLNFRQVAATIYKNLKGNRSDFTAPTVVAPETRYAQQSTQGMSKGRSSGRTDSRRPR